MAVVQANTFPGATAGDKINAAVASLATTGGIVDCTGFAGVQVIGVDICGGLSAQSIVPITFIWGPETYRVSITQSLFSHHRHLLRGTTFVIADANGNRLTGVTMWLAKFQSLGGPGNGVSFTDGGNTLTKASPGAAEWSYLEAGSPISVFGIIPALGNDVATLSASIGPTDVTIPVTSTTGFPSSGYLRIDDEVVSYTGITATSFTGCTRGYGGTTPANHLGNFGHPFRCVYEPFIADSSSASTINLGEGRVMDFAATSMDIHIGSTDIVFDGTGTFDGNMDPANDDLANPVGIRIFYGRHCYLGSGLTFINWDHGGTDFQQVQDCEIHSRYVKCGRPSLQLGVGVWLFGRCKRTVVTAAFEECYIGIAVDDRSTIAQLNDGPCEDCVVRARHIRRCNEGILLSGGRRNFIEAPVIDDLPSTGIGIVAQAVQWITNVAGDDNVLIVGVVQGATGFQAVNVDSNYVGKRLQLTSLTRSAPLLVSSPGVGAGGTGFREPKGTVSLAYGATVATDASLGDHFEIRVTNNTAFTIANPTNSVEDQDITYTIYNNSGGAMGSVTWGSEFKLAGAFTTPANGQRRVIRLVRRAGAWREAARTAADQPN